MKEIETKTILLSIFLALVMALMCNAEASISIQASWYSIESLKKEGTYRYSEGIMANGEKFNDLKLTCATHLYPLGSLLRVSRIAGNRGFVNDEEGLKERAVIVKVTDRINKRFATTRIDLSKVAFMYLLTERESLNKGILKVEVERIG